MSQIRLLPGTLQWQAVLTTTRLLKALRFRLKVASTSSRDCMTCQVGSGNVWAEYAWRKIHEQEHREAGKRESPVTNNGRSISRNPYKWNSWKRVRNNKYGKKVFLYCNWVLVFMYACFGGGQECVVWVFTLVGGHPIVHSSFRPNAAVFPIPLYSCVWRTSRARAQFGSLPL